MLYMNLIGGILIGSSLISSKSPKFPETRVSENTKWEMVDENENLTIYERWIELPDGGQTRERKCVFYVDNQVEDIVPYVTSAEGIKNWMRGVEETTQLEKNADSKKVVYILFDAPWPFRNRDLITQITTINDCDEPCTEVFMSAIVNYIPEKNRIVRMNSYEGRWKITELQSGKTEIIFSAFSNTPPVVPKWIQDPITEKLFEENLLNLKELLTQN